MSEQKSAIGHMIDAYVEEGGDAEPKGPALVARRVDAQTGGVFVVLGQMSGQPQEFIGAYVAAVAAGYALGYLAAKGKDAAHVAELTAEVEAEDVLSDPIP